MRIILLKWIFCMILSPLAGQGSNKLIQTWDSVGSCKQTLKLGSSNFSDTFPLDLFTYHHLEKDEKMHLKLYVQIEEELRIILTNHDVEEFDMDYFRYEFMLGIKNSASILLRDHVIEAINDRDHDLFTPLEPTPIEIVQTTGGKISLFIPGYKSEPILTYDDAEIIDLHFISFYNPKSKVSKWFYDCDLEQPGVGLNQGDGTTDAPIPKYQKNKNLLNLNGPLWFDEANLVLKLRVHFPANQDDSLFLGNLNLTLTPNGIALASGSEVDMWDICVENLNKCPENLFQYEIIDLITNVSPASDEGPAYTRQMCLDGAFAKLDQDMQKMNKGYAAMKGKLNISLKCSKKASSLKTNIRFKMVCQSHKKCPLGSYRCGVSTIEIDGNEPQSNSP